MRALIVAIYVITMGYFLVRGYFAISGAMLFVAVVFIGCLPTYKEHSIKVAKKDIINAMRKKQKNEVIKPFIDVNSAPWYILAELPGVSIQMAKEAVNLRKQNGDFPSINVFIALIGVKQIYVEHIKTVAYVKKEIPPVNI